MSSSIIVDESMKYNLSFTFCKKRVCYTATTQLSPFVSLPPDSKTLPPGGGPPTLGNTVIDSCYNILLNYRKVDDCT